MCCMPDYLILDEPVDGLDPVMRRQVWSLIMQDVAERGTTVLVSSHNLRELEDVCDRVGMLARGGTGCPANDPSRPARDNGRRRHALPSHRRRHPIPPRRTGRCRRRTRR